MRELKIVATPIGNRGDITKRAIRTIREADAVICENVGKTRAFLESLSITGKKFFQYSADTPFYADRIFKKTARFEKCVFLSSAGTPLVSDPGFLIVKEAYIRGIKVYPVPGVSSLISLLSVCPVKINEFVFMGFAPKKRGKLARKLVDFLKLGLPVLMLASKRELPKIISVLEKVDLAGEIFAGREMTKKFEEYRKFDKLSKFKLWVESGLKGEFTLVVFPKKQE